VVSPAVRETLHATDQVATDLEESRLTLGQGPRVRRLQRWGPVLAADLDSPQYLALWPVSALDSGARAVFALPLQVGAIRLGVLDLYRSQPGPLAPHELADALAFADTAGMLLLDAAATARS
jgi:hypothetical protein